MPSAPKRSRGRRGRGNAGSKGSVPEKEQPSPESAWPLPRKPVPTETAPLAGKKDKQAPEASSSSEKTGTVPKTGPQTGKGAEAQPSPTSKGLPSGPGNARPNAPGRAQQPSKGEITILEPAAQDPKQTKPTGKVPPPIATTSQPRQAVPSFSLPRPLFAKRNKDSPTHTEPPPLKPSGLGPSGPIPPIPDQSRSDSSSKQPPIPEAPRTGPPGAVPPLSGAARSGPSFPLPSRPGQRVADAQRPGAERQEQAAQGKVAGLMPERPGPAPSFPLPNPKSPLKKGSGDTLTANQGFPAAPSFSMADPTKTAIKKGSDDNLPPSSSLPNSTKSPLKKPSGDTLPPDQGFPAPLRLGNLPAKGLQKAGAAAGVLPQKKPTGPDMDEGFLVPLRFDDSPSRGPQKAGAPPGAASQNSKDPKVDQKGGLGTALPPSGPTEPNRTGVGVTQQSQKLKGATGMIARKPVNPFGSPPRVELPGSLPPRVPVETAKAPGSLPTKTPVETGKPPGSLPSKVPAQMGELPGSLPSKAPMDTGVPPGLLPPTAQIETDRPPGSLPSKMPTQTGVPPGSLPSKPLPTETPSSLRPALNPLQSSPPNASSQPGKPTYINALRSSPPNPSLQSGKPTGKDPLRSPPSKRPIQTGVPPGAHPLQMSPPSTLSPPGTTTYMNPLRSSPPNPSQQPGQQSGYRTSVYRPSMANAPPQKQDTAPFVPFRPPNGEPSRQTSSSNAVPPRVASPPGPRLGDTNMSKNTAMNSATATSSRPPNPFQRQNTGLTSIKPADRSPDLEKGTREYYSGEAGAPPPTPYTNMLLSLDKVPRRHNILVLLFVWILLVGFVVLPGSFTSSKRKQTEGETQSVRQGKLALTPANTAALAIGFVCVVAGAFGSAWLALRWRRNHVWLLNKLYMPLILDAAAGLLGTVTAVYAQQGGEWSAQATVVAIIEGGILGVGIVLFLLYNYWLLKRIRGSDYQGGYGKEEKKREKKNKAGMSKMDKKEEKERKKREKRERKERKKWENKKRKGRKMGGGFFARFGRRRKMPPVASRKFV